MSLVYIQVIYIQLCYIQRISNVVSSLNTYLNQNIIFVDADTDEITDGIEAGPSNKPGKLAIYFVRICDEFLILL